MAEAATIQKIPEILNAMRPALEARRRRYRRFLILGAVIIVCAVAAWALLSPSRNGDETLLTTVFAALLPSVIYYNVLTHFYRKGGKARFIDEFCKGIGCRYHPQGAFDASAMGKHKILPPAHIQSSEDGFEGTYNGIAFALQEVQMNDLERDPNYKRRKREVIVFHGVLIRLQMPRAFEGHTVIMPNNKLLTWFRTKFSEFERVSLVAPKFERRYDVMGTDQIEARVIMNPAFIERFTDAGDLFKARYLEASFLDNEILFAVARNRPLFEFDPLWQKVTNERLRLMTAEIETVMGVIDVLRLNRRIAA